MNNPKSMVGIAPSRCHGSLAPLTHSLQVLGWVSLIAVAGVSFYFAKQNINERRRQQDIAGERPGAKLDCEYHGYDLLAYLILLGGQGGNGLPGTRSNPRMRLKRSYIPARTQSVAP